MRYLLDTHAVIWMRENDPRFSRIKWEPVLYSPGNEVCVSIVSLWEIAIKRALGKLRFEGTLEDFAGTLETRQGFKLLQLEVPHLSHLEKLERHHRDPFDRLLIAQAIETGAVAVTNDRDWRAYPVRMEW